MFDWVTFELGDIFVEVLGGFSVQGVGGGSVLGRQAVFFVFVHVSWTTDWDVVKAFDNVLGGLPARAVALGVIFSF